MLVNVSWKVTRSQNAGNRLGSATVSEAKSKQARDIVANPSNSTKQTYEPKPVWTLGISTSIKLSDITKIASPML